MSLEDAPDAVVRVTREEASAARPAPSRYLAPAMPVPEPPAPRINQLAALSLGIAVAGVPLPGLLLGPIALLCGAIALSSADQRRGAGLAVAGMILGVVEFVGWGIGVWFLLSAPGKPLEARVESPFFEGQPADISGAPARIQHALRANVRVECSGPNGGSGAGIVVAASAGDAFMLTNEHVVECANDGGKLEVVSASGVRRPAELRWRAPHGVDAAMIRASGFSGFEVMDARKVTGTVGDPVFVIGNPMGLAATYTEGTVSALRSIAEGPLSLHVLQIQASVNHGNSGGGLYTHGGELLGLVTWTADKKLAEGIGFAISIVDLVALLESESDLSQELGLTGQKIGAARQ